MKYQNELLTVNLAITRISGISSNWSMTIGHHASEFGIMFVLMSKERVTQKDICDMTAMPKQTVNNIIREWKKNAYIKLVTHPKDKRVKYIELTDAGESYINDALKPVYAMQQDVVETMGKDKFIDFVKSLDEYYRILTSAMIQDVEGE